jgi:hypothetical protein
MVYIIIRIVSFVIVVSLIIVVSLVIVIGHGMNGSGFGDGMCDTATTTATKALATNMTASFATNVSPAVFMVNFVFAGVEPSISR